MTFHALLLDTLDNVPTGILCLAFVVAIILAGQVGLHVFNLVKGQKRLPCSNEVTGLIFGAISLIYSLILAFVIVAVWGNYEDLSKTISTEADKLNSIMAHTATLPDSVQREMKLAMSNYCSQVMEKEWKMEKPNTAETPSAIPQLRMMLLEMVPRNKTEENVYTVLDNDLSTISDLRRNRLNHTQSQVPDLVWLILKAGSIVLIVFSYFLNVESADLKRIYLAFLSGYIAMCMFLVYSLDHPFNGNAQVSRQPYVKVLLGLEQYYAINK